MKIKLIFFTLLVIFLVACTTVTVKNNNAQEIISTKEDIEDSETITRNEAGIAVDYEKVESDIIIENTQLAPDQIKIPLGNTTEIIIQNKDNLTYKLEIPMYGSEKQRDIYPYESVIVKLTPKVKGFTPIKLGQFTMGTIEVQ